ncbi:hypothetical protein GEMRC1_014137 [Eukaryota sp. GEM-RC1]
MEEELSDTSEESDDDVIFEPVVARFSSNEIAGSSLVEQLCGSAAVKYFNYLGIKFSQDQVLRCLCELLEGDFSDPFVKHFDQNQGFFEEEEEEQFAEDVPLDVDVVEEDEVKEVFESQSDSENAVEEVKQEIAPEDYHEASHDSNDQEEVQAEVVLDLRKEFDQDQTLDQSVTTTQSDSDSQNDITASKEVTLQYSSFYESLSDSESEAEEVDQPSLEVVKEDKVEVVLTESPESSGSTCEGPCSVDDSIKSDYSSDFDCLSEGEFREHHSEGQIAHDDVSEGQVPHDFDLSEGEDRDDVSDGEIQGLSTVSDGEFRVFA